MTNTIPTYVALILISLLSLSTSDPIKHNGFTADLIQRDSPQSPWYDPSLTPSQRIANAIRRSLRRVQRFASMQSPLSEIINSGGEYLMKYSIGSPPVPSLGIADTGSDIIWTQCQPCLQCFNQTLPVFNPKNSSTYRKIRCSAPICEYTRQSSCSNGRSSCRYTESYGDGSFTEGDLARETITLASAGAEGVISVPKVVIGCGTRNGGVFMGGESGIVGLGGGNLSLVSQLGPLAGGKFSYCLVPFSGTSKNSSKLSFGANAVVSGTGVVSTPLIRKEDYSYYFTTLLGISFGNQRFDLLVQEEGNILVDSGTTLTILPSGLYEKLKEAIQRTINLRQVADPTGVLELCFETRSDHVRIPDITVHFKGADLKWKVENVIVRVSHKVVCLAVRTAGDLAVYGSFAQINYMVGFDLLKKTVSFKPTDCGMV